MHRVRPSTNVPAVSVPVGPMEGHRWAVEPITHTVRSHGPRHCLRVRTGFLWFFLTFALSIGLCLFPFSALFPNGPLALWISPLAAFGMAVPLVRFYRSIFWEVTFDTSRQIVELRRWRRVETLPLDSIVGFQICSCIDEKVTGFIRWQSEFYQLILVYMDGGEYHRRLITSSVRSGECERLLASLSSHVTIDVKRYHYDPGTSPNLRPVKQSSGSGVKGAPPSVK